MARIPISLCLLGVVGGCGAGKPQLRLDLIEASVQRPSNIAVYFTVETSDGEPVPGLSAQDFQISEDGRPVSALESKQTILNQEVAAEHFTLLLIDMSGSVSESGDVPVILEAAKSFAERVQKYQKVAVYAFDGEKKIHSIAGFSTGSALFSGIARMERFHARDPSTNLNGAVVQAIDVLDRQLRRSSAPLTFGTLVIFTDGTDRAARVSREQVQQAVDETSFDILTIGVGDEIDPHELSLIGRDGAITSRDRGEIAAKFEEAAARVEASSRKYYLLGYCSPAREGEHDLTITTTWNGTSGALTYRFNARGFGPKCDPTKKPSFNLRRPKPRVATNRR
jgi:hypothetical protein